MQEDNFLARFFRLTAQIPVIWSCLGRRAELDELVEWAKRKKLPHPLRLYANRLADEEARLLRYTVLYPRLTSEVRRMFGFVRTVTPAPR